MTKILVVDDDLESRELLREFLEVSGYVPEAVASAQGARDVLSRDSDFRIVIADFQMPHESGLDLLRTLREVRSTYEVILMSSFMSEIEKKEAVALGALALLDKPLQLSEMLARLAELAAPDAVGISQ